MKLIRFVCLYSLTSLACSSPRARQQTARDSLLGPGPEHLAGTNVRRFPPDSSFVERYRYLLNGKHVGANCFYVSGMIPLDKQDELDDTREEDLDRCIQLRVVGHVKERRVRAFSVEPGDNVRSATGRVRSP